MNKNCLRKSILIIEDDQVDALTVKRALKDINIQNTLEVQPNGEDALNYLKDNLDNLPCLILLDINMPKMNGIEFLKELKSDEDLKQIPAIVLTTSKEESDREACFKNGVSGYMVKPVKYLHFLEILRTIDRYWTISEMPN